MKIWNLIRIVFSLFVLYLSIVVSVYAYYVNKAADNLWTHNGKFEMYQKKIKNIQKYIPF